MGAIRTTTADDLQKPLDVIEARNYLYRVLQDGGDVHAQFELEDVDTVRRDCLDALVCRRSILGVGRKQRVRITVEVLDDAV